MVLAMKPSSQGETISQSPITRFAHSSHSANAESVARARPPSTKPAIQAFHAGVVSAVKPMIQGEMNRQIARTRLIQSWPFLPSISFIAMTTSIEKLDKSTAFRVHRTLSH
ncbi:hypothetical protein AJ88_39840 [Mesorhizobium amorphae CCBAU 01583]|nr:hypothetical protein AJ88_39840 [Mesorhizobium amorphae CCBAU 01583]